MRESKYLNKIELHDLFADLKAYEFELGIRTEEEPSASNPTKALTTTILSQLIEDTTRKTAEQMSGEAMSLFIKRFGKFMCNNKKFKPYYKQDHIEDGPACFNYGKQGHFIADCTKPENEERKLHYEKKKGKEGRRTYRKKEQKVLVADEGKIKWAEIDSNSTDTDSSSEESEEEQVQCLMANSIHEEDDIEVLDFNSSDFTQEELIQALNEMVAEYKKLSISFEEAKTEKSCLIDKSRESSCLQQKELDGLKTKLNLLATENDNMKRVFQTTFFENQKLLKTINAWNKASVSLDKIHENQKQAGDKTGLGYGSNECNGSKENTQLYSSGNNTNVMRFVRSSTIYEHAEPDIDVKQPTRYEKGKHEGLGYVKPKIPRKEETWNKPRLNEKKMGKQTKFKQSRFEPSQLKYRNHRVLSVKSVEKNSATERSTWYLDSGFSRHITGNKDLLSEIIQYKGPKIISGNNAKGKTVGKGKITHAFDAKADEVIFVGFSSVSRAYRVFNKRSLTIEESIHVIFDETTLCAGMSQTNIQDLASRLKSTVLQDESDSDDPPDTRDEQAEEIIQPNEGGVDHINVE
ncbi:uncharacterized protein [Henckelia pumila]|uniref:uncharacterized protein n=1 Tax=Henckelia pumila TaxID=405737 RepID=UPI003C6DC3F7